MEYDPISVALKFGFLAVLYLFLLVIARSALKDLRRTAAPAPDATGFHAAPASPRRRAAVDAWLVAERGGGLEAEARFDLIGGLSIGRSKRRRRADRGPLRLRHPRPRLPPRRPVLVEDMNSTNGTLLNGASLRGEAELIDGDTIQIGDTVFRFEQ